MQAAVPFVLTVLVVAGCVGAPQKAPVGETAPLAEIVERQLTPKGVSASEVSIAANPQDPANLVAAANSQGGFGVYWTNDAGETWTASTFPASKVDPLPTGQGRYSGLSDPAVAFGPDGTVYLAGLSIIPVSGVFVAKSTDGGATWQNGRMVHESDLAASFNDKEWIGVSPKGTLVVAWQKEPLLDSLRTVDGMTGIDADIGDVVFARSTNGGQTWSLPTKVSRGLHNNGTQVAFTSDGRGHLLWVNYEASTLDYAASEDDGATWSAPRPIVKIAYSGRLPRYADIHTLPGLAASPNGNTLAAVWHDKRNGDLDVYAVASADGGKTWTSEVRVHDDPVKNGAEQLYPWVAIDENARIHVTFYDPRPDPTYPRFQYYLASADGPDLVFGPTMNVSSVPFTAFQKAGGGGNESRGLGHYTGVAATSLGVFPAWADGRLERSAVFSARVPLNLSQAAP